MASTGSTGWTCTSCTLVNEASHASCDACRRRRGAGAPRGRSSAAEAAEKASAAAASSAAGTGAHARAAEGADGSLGYAARLTYREDLGGQLGAPELGETARSRADKVRELASLIGSASHLVVFTGAGISTSTGIPDFRGPNGVWTCQRRGQPMPKASVPFAQVSRDGWMWRDRVWAG